MSDGWIDLDLLVDRMKFLKEASGWQDLAPTAICLRSDGGIDIAPLIGVEDVYTVVEQLVALSPCETVYLINDAYVANLPANDPRIGTVSPGEMWMNGDRENVSEALTVLECSGGKGKTRTLRYDAILRMWDTDPVTTADMDAKGPLAEVVLRAMILSKRSLS